MRPRGAFWALVAILAVAVLTRFLALDADPPAWLQGAFISDEGWWADGARGKIFFNNYFADDFGTAWLVTPGYTWALEAIYHIAGVGTAQTRALAALSTVVTILALAWTLWREMGWREVGWREVGWREVGWREVGWREVGWREALVAALLLTLSPFYWVYGRIGLQEPLQGMMIALSFACWVGGRRHAAGALGAGLAMGLAITIKPNAVTLGLFPMTLVAAGSFLVNRAALSITRARAGLLREYLLKSTLAAVGIACVLVPVFFGHALPQWAAFKATLTAEAGANSPAWQEWLTLPGLIMISTELRKTINTPIWWNPAVWSPALMTAFWLYCLSLVLRLRGGWKQLLPALSPLETATLCWTMGTFAVLCGETYPADRRTLLVFPPIAMGCAIFLGRVSRKEEPSHLPGVRGRCGWFSNFLLWGVLSLPLLVLLKPPLTRLVMHLSAGLPVGREAGLAFAAAGTVMMLGWGFVLGVLALWGKPAERIGMAFLRRPVILFLTAGLLVVEGAIIGVNLAGAQSTMSEQQTRLRQVIGEGETVIGHVATTLLMPLKVRTVRRVSRFEFTPPHNPDVWDRLKPRYLIEMTHRNYYPATPLYDDLIRKGQYRLIERFGIGPFKDGEARFSFALYERPGR